MRLLSALPRLCCCAAALLAGCKASPRTEGTTTGAVTAAPGATTSTAPMAAAGSTAATAARGTLSLAAVAGRWNMRSVPEGGRDTSATTYVLTAKADTTGWTITFPNRKPIPMRVSVSGDSVIGEAGPFESARRKGVQVRTHTVMRHEGDRMVGTTVAHYATKGADSVLTLRTSGTKARGAR